jgi:hypothetical protein
MSSLILSALLIVTLFVSMVLFEYVSSDLSFCPTLLGRGRVAYCIGHLRISCNFLPGPCILPAAVKIVQLRQLLVLCT